MLNYQIRFPTQEESPQLAQTFALSFLKQTPTPELLEKYTRLFKLQLSSHIFKFLIAENDSGIIGMGGEVRHAGVSYIGYLGVIPPFRNQGIGIALFQRLLTQALQYNRTIELFSNPGVEKIYHKFKFEDRIHAHIFSLMKKTETPKSPQILVQRGIVPEWLTHLDRKVMGFDRSRFLKFLVEKRGGIIAYLNKNCYGILTEGNIGPILAKNDDEAKMIIEYFLSYGSVKMISSLDIEKRFYSFSSQIIHSCLKMRYGNPLKCNPSYIYAYHSFATS